MAPLKPVDRAIFADRRDVFHDSIVVAPLKRHASGVAVTARDQVFHDSIVVAPLKRRASGSIQWTVDVFHDSIVVAPLKHVTHWRQPCADRRVFHDSIVVAPLKLALDASHVAGVTRLPRLHCRGPIEASRSLDPIRADESSTTPLSWPH